MTWPAAFGSYLVFAGTISGSEIATGIVVAALTTLWAALIRLDSEVQFAFRGDALMRMLKELLRVPIAAIRVGARLLAAIAGRPPGRPVLQQFRYGAEDDPMERSRRAAAVLGASVAPDKFVLRIDKGRDVVLLHEIGESARTLDLWWLA